MIPLLIKERALVDEVNTVYIYPYAISMYYVLGARWQSGLSRHLDHDLVQEVVSLNPAVVKKIINLFNYIFDLFVSFSHL